MIRHATPLTLLAIAWLACLPFAAGAAETGNANQDEQILHLLNRISFGPTPGDVEKVKEVGIDAYIEQQLHGNAATMPSALQEKLDGLEIEKIALPDLARQFQPDMDEGKLSPEEREKLGKRYGEIVSEMSEQKILRALQSPAQLQEVMTDFWFNHFNVFFGKNLDRIFIATYERDAIRPYALGKFRDLLMATARHPAMMVYLDNDQNTDPNSVTARKVAQNKGKILGINENYAREIMELHTLGVDGGYTQTDVTTLAHILTGWGAAHGKDWADRSIFYFDPDRHDFSDKSFLGYHVDARHSGFNANDSAEVDAVLDMLAANPATAHHIAYELAQYFVADDPPPSLVQKLTQAFTYSSGDITVVLRTLFHAPEFWDPQYYNAKFKPPFRYVISAMRASDAIPTGDTKLLQGVINGMGEPLYRCQTPNGYSNTNDQWLNSDALLKRINIAKALAHFLNDNAGR